MTRSSWRMHRPRTVGKRMPSIQIGQAIGAGAANRCGSAGVIRQAATVTAARLRRSSHAAAHKASKETTNRAGSRSPPHTTTTTDAGTATVRSGMRKGRTYQAAKSPTGTSRRMAIRCGRSPSAASEKKSAIGGTSRRAASGTPPSTVCPDMVGTVPARAPPRPRPAVRGAISPRGTSRRPQSSGQATEADLSPPRRGRCGTSAATGWAGPVVLWSRTFARGATPAPGAASSR